MNLLKHCFVCLMAGVLVAVVSCKKEAGYEGGESARDGILVSFESGTLTADGDLDVKSTASFANSKYSLSWQVGDQISMFAYKEPVAVNELSVDNVVNFTDNVFTTASAGTTATFSGLIPALDVALPQGVQRLFAIYPACPLSVAEKSLKMNNQEKYFYKVSGASIADIQDGTGWRYCYFISTNGTIDVASRSIVTPPTFTMANALVKLSYNSTKPITRIDVVQDSNGLLQPGLSGGFIVYSVLGINTIYEGSNQRGITIENGGVLPAEVLFACRKITNGRTITFTFTAQDGTVAVKKMTATSEYGPSKVYNLGTITLDSWMPSQMASAATVSMGMGINIGGLNSVTPTEESIEARCVPGTWNPDTHRGTHRMERNDPITYETNANYDPITKATMDSLRAAGFSSVRLPVTWFNHVGAPLSNPGYIDQVWLKHVGDVIDLALNAGMYAVINMHHDAGTYDFCWLKADWSNYETISATFKNYWTQIATYFRHYDYRLLFEGYNEIVDEGKHWHSPASANGFKAANALNQDFVDAVRATGGLNATRNLIVSTYTTSEEEIALKNFVMPLDQAPGHLMVQIHSYRPNEFVTARTVGVEGSRLEFYESDKADINDMFNRVQTHILAKGWPCVMGEYGAFHKIDPATGLRNEEGRAEHAYYYTMKALQKGIVPMYWYNPMSYRERDSGNWTFPIMAQGLINVWADYAAAHSEQGSCGNSGFNNVNLVDKNDWQ